MASGATVGVKALAARKCWSGEDYRKGPGCDTSPVGLGKPEETNPDAGNWQAHAWPRPRQTTSAALGRHLVPRLV